MKHILVFAGMVVSLLCQGCGGSGQEATLHKEPVNESPEASSNGPAAILVPKKFECLDLSSKICAK